MADNNNIPSLDGPVIHRIVLVDLLCRDQASSFTAPSLPGHLLHMMLEGEIEQNVNGHTHTARGGNIVWYYENEQVDGKIIKAPWRFYTINFIAPTLSPPMYGQRVIRVADDIINKFKSIYNTWQDTQAPPALRHIRLHGLLLDLLADIIPRQNLAHRLDHPTNIWWQIEEKLRQDLGQPTDLNYIESLSHRSKRTIIRSCHLATNMSPMKRVKELRLSYAQGLVLHSDLSITDIAFQVGYSRIQELSRDYCKKYGRTPTEDRKHGPKYKEIDSLSNA